MYLKEGSRVPSKIKKAIMPILKSLEVEKDKLQADKQSMHNLF